MKTSQVPTTLMTRVHPKRDALPCDAVLFQACRSCLCLLNNNCHQMPNPSADNVSEGRSSKSSRRLSGMFHVKQSTLSAPPKSPVSLRTRRKHQKKATLRPPRRTANFHNS